MAARRSIRPRPHRGKNKKSWNPETETRPSPLIRKVEKSKTSAGETGKRNKDSGAGVRGLKRRQGKGERGRRKMATGSANRELRGKTKKGLSKLKKKKRKRRPRGKPWTGPERNKKIAKDVPSGVRGETIKAKMYLGGTRQPETEGRCC